MTSGFADVSYGLLPDLSVLLCDLFLFGEPLGDVYDSFSDTEGSSEPELLPLGAFLRNYYFIHCCKYKIKIINFKFRMKL